MKYYTAPSFERSLQGLEASRKERVKKAIQLAVAFFETGQFSQGLGLKPLPHSLWEIRAGLKDRVIFRKIPDRVEFLLVGSHDEIKRLLKRL
jgi:hypothetical protein